MEERIYTTQEVMRILRVSDQTVWRYIKQGKLKASKVGRQYLIKESELNTFLEKGTNSEQ